MKSKLLTVLFLLLTTTLVAFAEDNKGRKSEGEEKKETSEMALFFADNVNLRDKEKISVFSDMVFESVGIDTGAESLEYPAIDLYGEGSWRTDNLNPFCGVKPNIPDSFAIDMSQFSYPLDDITRVTSRYGWRRRYGRMHYGIDIKVYVGDTIRSAFDGKVRYVDYERRGYGHYVIVRHPNGLETLYAHNSKILVEKDQIVRAGEPIALGGNTGRSTGSHLHFETRFLWQAINPEHLIDFSTGIPKKESYLYVRGNSSKSSSRSSNSAIAKRSGPPEGVEVIVYRVKKGDTLSAIAQKHGTTVSNLCQANGISRNSILQIGQTLRIW